MSSDPRVQTDPTGPLPPSAPRRRTGRSWWVWALLVAMVVLPILEVTLIGAAAGRIGIWATIGLLLLSGFVGAWLSKREGTKAWQALKKAFGSGRMPSAELADGALVLVGGVMLMLPGFFTDIVGLLLLLPITRPMFRALLGAVVASQAKQAAPVAGLGSTLGSPFGTATRRREPAPEDEVIEGEVIPVQPREIDEPR